MSTPGDIDPQASANPEISNEEVEALLEKVEAGDVASSAHRADGVVKPYDLVAPEKIVRGRMPVLDRINERWVGEFQQALTELVRRPVEVSAEDVQVAAYGDWLAAFASPASLNLYSVSPWRGNALVAVDGRLLFVLVDSYYGGGGRVADSPARLALTPTEERLNRIVADALTSHFRDAFEPVASLQFEHQGTEVNPHYASIATPSEPVVVTRLDIALNGTGGAACFVVPLSLLDPVREKLAEGLQAASAESRERWYQGLRKQLERTELDLRSVFLDSELSMRELLSLKPGDIVPIEMPKTTTLCAGGQPLLRGKFGRSRGYNAVAIVETVPSEWTEDKQEGSRQ
jgi:flagellar motor switch protein FliM